MRVGWVGLAVTTGDVGAEVDGGGGEYVSRIDGPPRPNQITAPAPPTRAATAAIPSHLSRVPENNGARRRSMCDAPRSSRRRARVTFRS